MQIICRLDYVFLCKRSYKDWGPGNGANIHHRGYEKQRQQRGEQQLVVVGPSGCTPAHHVDWCCREANSELPLVLWAGALRTVDYMFGIR